MTDLAGSPEWEQMVEAGARAIHDHSRKGWGLEWDALMPSERSAVMGYSRAAIRAALSVVMQEPCSTRYCEDGRVPTPDEDWIACPDHRPGAPRWAVLRPLQDGGMLEQAFPSGAGTQFRVVPPTPEEGTDGE